MNRRSPDSARVPGHPYTIVENARAGSGPSIDMDTILEGPPADPLEHRPALELRAVGERIVGLAIPFDSRSRDLGGFVEVVKPSAVDRSLSGDVVALYNHEAGSILGRTPTTLQLTKEARGLAFTITPPDTTVGRETLTLVRRGDLTGASFGFRTIKDAWSRDASNVSIRELLDIEIAEISLTAFPAYAQTDVTIAMRSMQAWQNNGGAVEVQKPNGVREVQNSGGAGQLPRRAGQRIDWLRRRANLVSKQGFNR